MIDSPGRGSSAASPGRRRWIAVASGVVAGAALGVAVAAWVRDGRRDRRSAGRALEDQQRLAASLRSLTERMEDLRFSALLGPEIGGTPAGIGALRRALQRDAALRGERLALLARYEQTCQALLAELSHIDAGGTTAATLARRAEATEHAYRQLDAWQDERARRVAAALDWYGRYPAGQLEGPGGRATPEVEKARTEFRQLRNRVLAAEAEVRLLMLALDRPDVAGDGGDASPAR